MANLNYYFSKTTRTMVPLNRWDVAALCLIFGAIALLAIGTKQMAAPYSLGQALPISLAPSYLPDYALRSVLRMFFALFFAFLFTFTVGTWAAKSKRAERFLVPMIDILQSVPILGVMSITIVGFIALFHGSLLGPECAAIFAVFFSQVWNMTLSFYQSLRTVPGDLLEAAAMLHLSPWQRFWRIEVPFSMPALLWNTMMSMSGSWFFVVASEAISVSNQEIKLPGIGSYIALAIQNANGWAVVYAILAMLIVILLYDQLLFRPLVQWAEKFKTDGGSSQDIGASWVTRVLQRTYALQYFFHFFSYLAEIWVNFPLFRHKLVTAKPKKPQVNHFFAKFSEILVFIAVVVAITALVTFILKNITIPEVLHVFVLGFCTALRVIAVIIICSVIWVPIGVWIGMRPDVARIAQPIVQFLAAFPAYLLFPVVVILIVKFSLNVEIWVTPLLILGTQWYVLFNVVAGTMAIPKELHLAAANMGVRGLLRWRRLILPAIFPYYITGAITAGGGAWNTSVVAEVVSWGSTTLTATGLGAYISHYTATGNMPHIALGIGVMSLLVVLLNRLFWRPLYRTAISRYRLEMGVSG
ncbi:ABC transporter permease subunit [soil metagenome]